MFKFAVSPNRKSIVTRAMSELNIHSKGIQTKPIYINIDEAKDVPLCINCKYFNKHPTLTEANYGKCHKYGELNVIDGSILYKQVEVARQYFCHGNQYEQKDINKTDIEDYKDFLK